MLDEVNQEESEHAAEGMKEEVDALHEDTG